MSNTRNMYDGFIDIKGDIIRNAECHFNDSSNSDERKGEIMERYRTEVLKIDVEEFTEHLLKMQDSLEENMEGEHSNGFYQWYHDQYISIFENADQITTKNYVIHKLANIARKYSFTPDPTIEGEEIVDLSTGNRLFTDEQAEQYDSTMIALCMLCEAHSIDIYECCLTAKSKVFPDLV